LLVVAKISKYENLPCFVKIIAVKLNTNKLLEQIPHASLS